MRSSGGSAAALEGVLWGTRWCTGGPPGHPLVCLPGGRGSTPGDGPASPGPWQPPLLVQDILGPPLRLAAGGPGPPRLAGSAPGPPPPLLVVGSLASLGPMHCCWWGQPRTATLAWVGGKSVQLTLGLPKLLQRLCGQSYLPAVEVMEVPKSHNNTKQAKRCLVTSLLVGASLQISACDPKCSSVPSLMKGTKNVMFLLGIQCFQIVFISQSFFD